MRACDHVTRVIFSNYYVVLLFTRTIFRVYFLARVFGNFRFIPCYLPPFLFNLFGLNLEFEPIIQRELFLTIIVWSVWFVHDCSVFSEILGIVVVQF